MSLIVTGTIGIDTVHTPTGKAEGVLGGSCAYFAAAASFLAPVLVVAKDMVAGFAADFAGRSMVIVCSGDHQPMNITDKLSVY